MLRVLMLLCLALGWAASAGSRTANAAERSPARQASLALKPSFTPFARGALFAGDKGALVNGTTGRRSTVTAPGCTFVSAIGGSSIVFVCGSDLDQSYRLYSITSGGIGPLTVNPALTAGCTGPQPQCATISAVGDDWMQVTGPCEMEHCDPVTSFQSLSTGAVEPDPVSRTVVPDLDSPTLARRVCAPVTVPSSMPLDGVVWGSVQSDGRFQIAGGGGGSYLEQCGTTLHRFLTYLGCVFNAHVVVWESKPGRLSGMFLPSLRRFTISVPLKVDPQSPHEKFVRDNPYELALTTRTLYLSREEKVWTMPIPASPPKLKASKRPSHKRR
jgi:hypothetical protein